MHQITEKIYSISTWGALGAGIATNFDSVKSVILFFLALILSVIQIRISLIRLRKEKENKV